MTPVDVSKSTLRAVSKRQTWTKVELERKFVS